MIRRYLEAEWYVMQALYLYGPFGIQWVMWWILRQSPLLQWTFSGTHFRLYQLQRSGQFLKKCSSQAGLKTHEHWTHRQMCSHGCLGTLDTQASVLTWLPRISGLAGKCASVAAWDHWTRRTTGTALFPRLQFLVVTACIVSGSGLTKCCKR